MNQDGQFDLSVLTVGAASAEYPYGNQPEGIFFLWAIRDSNPGPTGYEPGALTN